MQHEIRRQCKLKHVCLVVVVARCIQDDEEKYRGRKINNVTFLDVHFVVVSTDVDMDGGAVCSGGTKYIVQQSLVARLLVDLY